MGRIKKYTFCLRSNLENTLKLAAGVIVWIALTLLCVWAFPIPVYAESSKEVRDLEVLVHTGVFYMDNEVPVYPDLVLEQNGRSYRLISTELKETTKEGALTYVAANIPYELEGAQEPPETTIITLKDESSGMEYEREVTCLEILEQEIVWKDDFNFPITVSRYDADTFWLGDLEITGVTNLVDYGEELLKYLGLSPECYRVENVQWIGESYEKDGIIFRDAVATGEKQVRMVQVKYGGQIRTPEIQGKVYESIYEEIIDTENVEEKLSEAKELFGTMDGTEEDVSPKTEISLLEQIRNFLWEHTTIVKVSLGFIVFLIVAAAFWWFSGKKDTAKSERQE